MQVITIGTFDLLHVGHVELLNGCRELAGAYSPLIVGLNRDEFVLRYKGQGPVIPYDERAALLRALRVVDSVVSNDGDENSGWLIDRYCGGPSIIAIGSDWQDRDYLGQLGITQAWLDERGHTIAYVPRTTGQSSTAIRQAIAA